LSLNCQARAFGGLLEGLNRLFNVIIRNIEDYGSLCVPESHPLIGFLITRRKFNFAFLIEIFSVNISHCEVAPLVGTAVSRALDFKLRHYRPTDRWMLASAVPVAGDSEPKTVTSPF
jgi:hypothetical protein